MALDFSEEIHVLSAEIPAALMKGTIEVSLY